MINKISEKFQHHISDEKRRFTPLPEDLDKTEPTEITDEEWSELDIRLRFNKDKIMQWKEQNLIF